MRHVDARDDSILRNLLFLDIFYKILLNNSVYDNCVIQFQASHLL